MSLVLSTFVFLKLILSISNLLIPPLNFFDYRNANTKIFSLLCSFLFGNRHLLYFNILNRFSTIIVRNFKLLRNSVTCSFHISLSKTYFNNLKYFNSTWKLFRLSKCKDQMSHWLVSFILSWKGFALFYFLVLYNWISGTKNNLLGRSRSSFELFFYYLEVTFRNLLKTFLDNWNTGTKIICCFDFFHSSRSAFCNFSTF